MTDVYQRFLQEFGQLKEEVSDHRDRPNHEFREEVEDFLSHFGFEVKNEVIPEPGPEGEQMSPEYAAVTYDVEQLPYTVQVKFRESGTPSLDLRHNGDGPDLRYQTITDF